MNHLGLRVCDTEKALKLYRDILGGKIIRDGHSNDGRSRYLYVQLCGGVIEMLRADTPAREGYAHIAFLTEHNGLDDAYNDMTSNEYTFHVPPKTASSGNGRLAFFRDEAGVEYELLEREEEIRKYPFETSLVTRYLFTEIRVPRISMQATKRLLTEKLGFVHCDDDVFRFGCDAIRVTEGAACIYAIHLEVKDLREAKTVLEENGYSTKETETGFECIGAGSEIICFEERKR